MPYVLQINCYFSSILQMVLYGWANGTLCNILLHLHS